MDKEQIKSEFPQAADSEKASPRATALQLYALLRLLDPVSLRVQHIPKIQQLARNIMASAQSLLQDDARHEKELVTGPPACLNQRDLQEIIALFSQDVGAEVVGAEIIGAEVVEQGCCKGFSSRRLRDFFAPLQKQLHSLYGRIVVSESKIPDKPQYLPEHRPGNYARSLFHSGGTLVLALLVALLSSPTRVSLLLALIAAIAWLIELGRMNSSRFSARFFALMGGLAHPLEHVRINSSVWLVTGTFVVSLFASRDLTIMAVLILGFADPVAGFVGRRFGKIPLVYGRTLEGSVAFFVVATLIAAATALFFHPAMGLLLLWQFAAISAAAGTVAELFSKGLDDNFAIPVVIGTVGYFFLAHVV